MDHVKPRLLGHFGTVPGQNLVNAHMNRAIRARGLDALYVSGPGHGGPGVVANAYLERTYSEVYPAIPQDEAGMRALFRQFPFPGGIPSHVAPETPGSIHEGGELGYAVAHAYGAAFESRPAGRCWRRSTPPEIGQALARPTPRFTSCYAMARACVAWRIQRYPANPTALHQRQSEPSCFEEHGADPPPPACTAGFDDQEHHQAYHHLRRRLDDASTRSR